MLRRVTAPCFNLFRKMTGIPRQETQGQARHLRVGARAEQFATSYLKQHGCEILEQNYNCRFGELDIVCLTGSSTRALAVVEVRYRQSKAYGGAAATVGKNKQQRIIKTASLWLQQNRQYKDYPLRFDVITLCGNPETPELAWLKNAFSCDGVV